MLSNQSKSQYQNTTSDSVPSNPEAQEPDAKASKAKLSEEDIIFHILLAVMTILIIMTFVFLIEDIAAANSWRDLWPMAVGIILAMPIVSIMTVSKIIHNKMKVVTGAVVIAMAVLIAFGMTWMLIALWGI